MVFESLVADLLNRFIGDYVENLDSKQLKIGIWGGDVVLENLVFKETALDNLNLPIKTVYGQLGKLLLKIPWKNLYGAPVVAVVENLVLICVPSQDVTYDEEKEKKLAKEAKQLELLKIEEAKKRESLKSLPKEDDTFVEKLSAQIIKNVQVNVKNIHIRYEDRITNPTQPYSCGITLSNLNVETTDDNWTPSIIQDAVTQIFKILDLEGLSVYWNCKSELYTSQPKDVILEKMLAAIPTRHKQPHDYLFVLGPINSTARLRLNQKPENDVPQFSIPKVLLNFEMEKLKIALTKSQYKDILILTDSMGFYQRAMPYRKHRPNVKTYSGHYRKWWQFAIKCVVEDVQRKHRNWNWNHMFVHRCKCRSYSQVYQTKLKLTGKKIPADLQEKLDSYEEDLDVLNLVLIRQRCELEIERMEKNQPQPTGWFRGWFSSGPTNTDNQIVEKFEQAMSAEEKAKLYQAIDYQEGSIPAEYPPEYVATKCVFLLKSLEIEIKHDYINETVLNTQLENVKCLMEQRPGGQSLKVVVQIQALMSYGLKQREHYPKIITSTVIENEPLIHIVFETNPLDKNVDQCVYVKSNPCEITYDSETIAKVVEIFEMPDTLQLDQLQDAAFAKINNFTEMSTAGLQYTIDKHANIDLNIELSAPFIIIPENGFFHDAKTFVVMNFGKFIMKSMSKNHDLNIRELSKTATSDQIFEEMHEHIYEKYIFQIVDVQVILANRDEDWFMKLQSKVATDLHILQPTTLTLYLEKCLIQDDPRLPKFKINGALPNLIVHLSDLRLVTIYSILASISSANVQQDVAAIKRKGSLSTASSLVDLATKSIERRTKSEPLKSDLIQLTELEAQFTISDIVVIVDQCYAITRDTCSDTINDPSKVLKFCLTRIEMEMVKKTYNQDVNVRLGKITLNQYRVSKKFAIIYTPVKDEDDFLFTAKLSMVDQHSPELYSKYESSISILELNFTRLDILLHQECLERLFEMVTLLQCQMDAIGKRFHNKFELESSDDMLRSCESQQSWSAAVDRVKRETGARKLYTIAENAADRLPIKKAKKLKVKKEIELIFFKLKANMSEVSLRLENEHRALAEMSVQQLKCNMVMRKKYTQMIATLDNILIHDLNRQSNYKNILSIIGGNALDMQLVMYNNDNENDDKGDVDIALTMTLGRSRVVYLNLFTGIIMSFLNRFQTAQQAIIDATRNAADAAVQNVQDAYSSAQRISLDISLHAPQILIPLHSKSSECLMMDLGFCTIKNKLINVNVSPSASIDEENDAELIVIDNISVTLQDIRLSRVKVALTYDVLNECDLLEPLSLLISVKRNLMAQCDKVPSLDIAGRLKLIAMKISEEDFKAIMDILNQNLQEGVKVQEINPQATEVAAIVKKTNDSTEENQRATIECDKAITKLTTFMKFTFTLDTLIIDLYTGGTKSVSSSSPSHAPENSLARFALDLLSLKGNILSDNSIFTSILLMNCVLDDTRVNRKDKVTRMMERIVDDDDQTDAIRSMIDVTYRQNADEMFVDVRVFRFNTILAVDYLMQISNFFTRAISTSKGLDEHAETDEDAVIKLLAAQYAKDEPRESAIARVKVKVAEPKPSQTRMIVNLRVEKPNIILIENMDSLETDALIVNNELQMKAVVGQELQMDCCLKNFTIYTCNYNPSKRKDTMHLVLKPLDIVIKGATPHPSEPIDATKPTNPGLHLDVVVTDVCLSVSPSTIALLNSCMVTMNACNDESSRIEATNARDLRSIWSAKSLKENKFWFFRTETAREVTESMELVESMSEPIVADFNEICSIAIPSIIITLEAGVGNKTLPIILLEAGVDGTAKNWSGNLHVETAITCEMSYYNSKIAVWEPLLEPNELDPYSDEKKYAPWQLKFEMLMENVQTAEPPARKQSIKIFSEKNLELTMTKSCMEAMTNLGKAFSKAVATGGMTKSETLAPFEIRNDLGVDVTLMLDKGSFLLFNAEQTAEVVLGSGALALLLVKPEYLFTSSKALDNPRQMRQRSIFVKVSKVNAEVELPVYRADKRVFPLNYRTTGDMWTLVSDVLIQDGCTRITLRSILQVQNHFHHPIDIYYMKASGNEVERIATIDENAIVNLPLHAVYSPSSEIFFSVSGYTVSLTPFKWKDLQQALAQIAMLELRPKERGKHSFYIRVMSEIEQVFFENTSKHTMLSSCYNIHLRPSISLRNYLPIPIRTSVCGSAIEQQIEPGHVFHLSTVSPGKSDIVIRLVDYLGRDWSCKNAIVANSAEVAVWRFESYDSETTVGVCLGMHTIKSEGIIMMSLYSPYWMINKTGLMLTYRSCEDNGSVFYHPETYQGPILFSFKERNFFGKKKAIVKVEHGEWSDKFSIDAAGASGVVDCKFNQIKYSLGVKNELSYNNLTRKITFTPYFVIKNQAPFAVEVQESQNAGVWLPLAAGDFMPFWPVVDKEDKFVRLLVQNYAETTPPFEITESHSSLLKLDNEFGGVFVDVQVTEGAIYTTVSEYQDGQAPALLINHSDHVIKYWEVETVTVKSLPARSQVLYTWENPCGPRLLMWNCARNDEIEMDLRKDCVGEFFLTAETKIYYASFLDGLQRTLLFTALEYVVDYAQNAGNLEQIAQEMLISIYGLGLSLTNNVTHQEVLYLGITSSGVIWERANSSGKFKPFTVHECKLIEDEYQLYCKQVEQTRTATNCRVQVAQFEIDFDAMQQIRPKPRHIRRSFQEGLWLSMKSSPHQVQLHAKINRLQIDNQLHNCIFPVVLAPVVPSKSVAVSYQPKPFVELSIFERIMPHTTIRQYKYFKVLVQEFQVNIELGLMNEIFQFIERDALNEAENLESFNVDLQSIASSLIADVELSSLQEQKNFYDLLHFSPLKIHLSFSMQGLSKDPSGFSALLNGLLQGVGVTLTDMQDVILKLKYFERDYTFLTSKQLTAEVTKHYTGQFVNQMYVLILGLDVIGNPFGLVLGITRGVEDLFYEPIQGAVQGPGEFAEGLGLGVRSLFGHTVGGAAGAVSKITGAMGKGIATLTFDKEYQDSRRAQVNQRPANFQEGIARSGKQALMGVYDGVTGVVMRPLEGAKQEGAGGFFKGLGKGAIGLVARPTAGLVDFASGSLDAVRRVTDTGEEVQRLRPARYLAPDTFVKPYCRLEAEGHKILNELDNGKYAETDAYVFHAWVIANKDVLLLTNKRMIYIAHDLFGAWNNEWTYTYKELSQKPVPSDKGLIIFVHLPKKKGLGGLFSSSDRGKLVLMENVSIRDKLIERIDEFRVSV